ncbi:methanogenesis marker 3 protein [archaeon]|nr:MAG: methanogenesis marker 3 protein [archaeon]
MKVTIDGNEVETNGRTLLELIERTPTKSRPIIMERRTTKEVSVHNTYVITTSKGELTMEAYDNRFHEFFASNLDKFAGLKAVWTDKKSVNFGTLALPFEITRKQFTYNRYEVLFGFSGFERGQGVLTLSKVGFIGRNGIEKSAFGRIVKGRHILEALEPNDVIESIHEKRERSEMYDYTVVTGENVELEDGDTIITKLGVEMNDAAPVGSEHFLFLTNNGYLTIRERLATYCKDDTLKGVDIPSETIAARSRGSLSVRTSGKQVGSVYLYFKDTIEDDAHSVIGRVVSGIELAEQAHVGQEVRVETTTPRLNTLGMTQREAERMLASQGLNQQRTGEKDDDAIVIEQDPELTVEARGKGAVETRGIDPAYVFTVTLYAEEAPETVGYFKTVTGLKTRALGRLDVFFAHEELDMILFSGDTKLAGSLHPEHIPQGTVRRGQIGITNMASRQRGVIGIRFDDNAEYGPTGEDFEHTNLVGEIDEVERLRSLSEGDNVYFILK